MSMNGEQIIPSITDPLGAHWKQPHRRYIELDETHALMSERELVSFIGYISGHKYVADLNVKIDEIKEFEYALNLNTGDIRKGVGYSTERMNPPSDGEIELYNSLIDKYFNHD